MAATERLVGPPTGALVSAGCAVTDGGALRLHLSATESRDVLPLGGTFACFLAERYEHEVMPATRDRLSIAGWFKRRGGASSW